MSNEQREQQIKEAAKQRADQYSHPVDWSDTYYGFIDGAKWADSHPQWIPVEEELPKRMNENSRFSDTVLVYNKGGYQDTAYYDYEEKIWRWLPGVTHWMPLPQAPRKEDKNDN